jgi:hypothetical protein
MKSVTWLYVAAVILFIIAACGLGLGGFMYVGSTEAYPEFVPWAMALLCAGVLAIPAGVAALLMAVRKTKQDTAQNVTYKVDLSGDVKVEQMTCKNCGGALKPENVKMVMGAPVVECPFCGTSYQLTEEPKW